MAVKAKAKKVAHKKVTTPKKKAASAAPKRVAAPVKKKTGPEIDLKRLKSIKTLVNGSGGEPMDYDAKDKAAPKVAPDMCVMEAVAYVTNEPWSDHPRCASPTITSFLIGWNDTTSEEDRDKYLIPIIPAVVGTASREKTIRKRFEAWKESELPKTVLSAAGMPTMAAMVDSKSPMEKDLALGAFYGINEDLGDPLGCKNGIFDDVSLDLISGLRDHMEISHNKEEKLRVVIQKEAARFVKEVCA